MKIISTISNENFNNVLNTKDLYQLLCTTINRNYVDCGHVSMCDVVQKFYHKKNGQYNV